MSADPALTAGLGQDGAWPFMAIRIDLPDTTLRLLDGAARISIGSEDYAGSDPDYGALLLVEAVSEDLENEAPEVRIVLQPDSAATAATLVNPAMQGSEVRIMIGCMNPATGTPIGTPEVIFFGEVDVPRLRIADKTRQVEFVCASVFERLGEVDEGERASDAFHQAHWPGELGLSLVSTLLDPAYWGTNPPAGALGSSPYVSGQMLTDPYTGARVRYG